jgi:dTDP-4-dehydrorhamnose reductase
VKTLLITGASGFLGPTLCERAAKQWNVAAAMHRHPVPIPHARAVGTDLGAYAEARELLAQLRPDAVIHAAALSNTEYCQTHPAESEAINVEASANLAGLAADRGIPFVFTSTDLVFDGERAPYSEDSAANPISVYGEHKLRAEAAIRQRHPDAVICRLPLLLGPRSVGAEGFLAKMLGAMQRGEQVRMFEDEVRTPVAPSVAADGLLLALEKARGTTLHLGGPERLTRWAIGRLAAEVAGVDVTNVVPCRRGEIPMAAPRPRDVSMDSSRAAALGYRPPPLREQLERAFATSPPRS